MGEWRVDENQMSDLEIEKCLVVSISHLKLSEVKHLEKRGGSVRHDEWSISFPLCEADHLALSDGVSKLIRLARDNDCTRIRFDGDAEVVDGYETFKWW